MKVNAENFLLDNGSLATKENIFFITGNDDSVIKQVEKKLIEKAEISDTFEIYKTDQASIMAPDDLVDSQGSIFNETKACIHNSPRELNIDIFKNFEKVSLPIIINSPKTKAGTKVKNFFDRHENFLSISCYQITRDFKQKIIQNFLSSKKTKLDDSAFWFLIDNISNNLEILLSELEKISNYNKEILNVTDIRLLLSINEGVNFDEIFFSVIASRKKIIILSNSYINSAQDAFIFLNRFKFFFNLLSDAQTLKENKSSLIKIETIFPRYLFKYKKAFIEIVNKIDTKKIFEIGNVLLRAEILLKKNGENYISIVQRLLIKSRQIIK